MSVSYETRVVIDSISFGLALNFFRNNGFSFTDRSPYQDFNEAALAYGSEILPLPQYTPPTGSYVVNDYTRDALYFLYDEGTLPSQFSMDRLWIPNLISSNYSQQYYKAVPPSFTDYYSSFSLSGNPQGSPYVFYGKELQSRLVSIWTRTRYLVTPVGIATPPKPNYISLLAGYVLDERKIPELPIIVSPITTSVQLSYYRENKLEQIGFRTIDWMYYSCDLIKGEKYILPIKDIVLGTLYCSDQNILNAIIALDTVSGKYPYSDYLPSSIASLFTQWFTLFNAIPIITSAPPNATNVTTRNEISRQVRTIGANNNFWSNRPNPTPDLNRDDSHPLFSVDDNRAYNWHIKPQSNGSYGNLIMDSPRTIEMHAALNAGKWGVNPDDSTLLRVDNLGWRINRLCDIVGIRVNTDGTINPTKDKKLVRQVVDSKKRLEPKDIGVVSFGNLGMVIKRITNRFKRKGKENEIVSDQCVIVQDLPQLMQEYFEQFNLALGLQESSAIEIKQGEKGEDKAIFNSQLEILIEMFTLLSSANEMTRAALVSSLVTQSQTNELIAGLGLPSVTKTIPIQIGNKVTQLPFKGIAAHRSISQEIATCTYNVGLVTGQLL